VHGHARAGSGSDAGGGAKVVAVGEDDALHAGGGELRQRGIGRLDGIDAQVAVGALHQIAVEVVSEALGEPGPGQDSGDDLTHGRTAYPSAATGASVRDILTRCG
jgi:hypothetical protein